MSERLEMGRAAEAAGRHREVEGLVRAAVGAGSSRGALRVADHRPRVLGLPALPATTMPERVKAIRALEARGFRERIRVMVGDATLEAGFAVVRIGADGCGWDTAEAVAPTRRLASREA